jgi:hypothetical protein
LAKVLQKPQPVLIRDIYVKTAQLGAIHKPITAYRSP